MNKEYFVLNLIKRRITMSKNDKKNNPIEYTTNNNDIIFPLVFGIVTVIIMAVVSKAIGM